MKVTFYYDRLATLKVWSEGATFEFITESYHRFLSVAEGMSLEEKKKLKVTFDQEK